MSRLEKLEHLLDDFLPGWEALFDELLNSRIDSPRNRELRKTIGLQVLSGLLADDERARLFKLPASCRIRENTKILMPEKLVCGEHVWIGENAYLDASGGLTIGDHTTIGVGVYIWTHTSLLANMEMANLPGGDRVVRRSTTIGKGCYIVGHSVINPGVTIGNGAVVLPMSCVTRDVPDGIIVAGSPAKPIAKADDTLRVRLREELFKVRSGISVSGSEP